MTPRSAADKAERTERLAAEMRKNLIKRKQQQKEKRGGSQDQQAADDDD